MSLKLYIAGASAEIDEIEPRMKRLREVGATITGDWCADIRAAGTANVGLSDVARAVYAKRDLEAVSQAEMFWLLVPTAQSIGCWVELGAVLERTAWHGVRPIIIVSGDSNRTIFTALSDREFASHDDAEEFAAEWARRGAHII